MVCVAVEPVPVMVIGYVPGVVAEATVAVIVDDPPAVTDDGLKPIVTPAGWPLALRITVCADPLVIAVLIVDVPLLPCATLRLLGLALIEKFDATTVNATEVVCVALVPVPVTVIV